MKIAITGPSGSGKSTIARMLAKKLGFPHLCQDDYWMENNPRKFCFNNSKEYISNSKIFEFADSYDGEKLCSDAMVYPDVIVEGFTAMTYPCIRNIIDRNFFIDVPWDICKSRRLSRIQQSNTPPSHFISSQTWMDLGERFNALNVGFQKDLVGTSVIDGRDTTEVCVNKILDVIQLLHLR